MVDISLQMQRCPSAIGGKRILCPRMDFLLRRTLPTVASTLQIWADGAWEPFHQYQADWILLICEEFIWFSHHIRENIKDHISFSSLHEVQLLSQQLWSVCIFLFWRDFSFPLNFTVYSNGFPGWYYFAKILILVCLSLAYPPPTCFSIMLPPTFSYSLFCQAFPFLLSCLISLNIPHPLHFSAHHYTFQNRYWALWNEKRESYGVHFWLTLCFVINKYPLVMKTSKGFH